MTNIIQCYLSKKDGLVHNLGGVVPGGIRPAALMLCFEGGHCRALDWDILEPEP